MQMHACSIIARGVTMKTAACCFLLQLSSALQSGLFAEDDTHFIVPGFLLRPQRWIAADGSPLPFTSATNRQRFSTRHQEI